MSASPTLPPLLAANPRLDQWVRFPSPGHVTVSTGRVEIGQGVLTAMLQIAAEELDVAPDRILLQTGDTDLTPMKVTLRAASRSNSAASHCARHAPRFARLFSTIPRRISAIRVRICRSAMGR